MILFNVILFMVLVPGWASVSFLIFECVVFIKFWKMLDIISSNILPVYQPSTLPSETPVTHVVGHWELSHSSLVLWVWRIGGLGSVVRSAIFFSMCFTLDHLCCYSFRFTESFLLQCLACSFYPIYFSSQTLLF